MFQEIPESLIEKVKKTLRESEESEKTPEPEKKDEAKPEEKKDEGGNKKKGEKIIFNPEVRPDVYTEPYKVQPTS